MKQSSEAEEFLKLDPSLSGRVLKLQELLLETGESKRKLSSLVQQHIQAHRPTSLSVCYERSKFARITPSRSAASSTRKEVIGSRRDVHSTSHEASVQSTTPEKPDDLLTADSNSSNNIVSTQDRLSDGSSNNSPVKPGLPPSSSPLPISNNNSSMSSSSASISSDRKSSNSPVIKTKFGRGGSGTSVTSNSLLLTDTNPASLEEIINQNEDPLVQPKLTRILSKRYQ